jgi:hypothetical protein
VNINQPKHRFSYKYLKNDTSVWSKTDPTWRKIL